MAHALLTACLKNLAPPRIPRKPKSPSNPTPSEKYALDNSSQPLRRLPASPPHTNHCARRAQRHPSFGAVNLSCGCQRHWQEHAATHLGRLPATTRGPDAKPTPLDIATLSQAQLAQLVSVVLTAKPSVENLSVEQIVGLGRSPYTNIWGTLRAEDHRMVGWAMDVVGITNLRQRMVQTLSDGERQKMMIAKALAQDTPVMLLDEPTAFLDYKSKVEMLALLSRLAHETNKMVLLSTHDLEQAVHTADALWVITKAQQATNTPQENPSCTSPQHLATLLRVLEKHIRTDEQGLQQIVFEPEDKAENTASQGLTLTATADFDQRTHALLRLLGEGK